MPMGAIQVKEVPEELHEALRRRAVQEGMTLADYVLDLIRRDLGLPRQAVEDLLDAPLRRLPTLPLLPAVWTLRANVASYDACYVALARDLGCPLVTADRKLPRAPGLGGGR
jgi:predicted nucleic acid-binding protein